MPRNNIIDLSDEDGTEVYFLQNSNATPPPRPTLKAPEGRSSIHFCSFALRITITKADDSVECCPKSRHLSISYFVSSLHSQR